MGAIGFVDDYLKVVSKRTDGLAGRFKLLGQSVFGIALALLYESSPSSNGIRPEALGEEDE